MLRVRTRVTARRHRRASPDQNSAVWRLRALVGETQGAWLRALALARMARLASLPFALGLLAAFALSFVVIAAAVVALVLAVLA